MKKQGSTALFTYEMTIPTIVVILIMTVYPVIFTVLYSFTDYNYLKGTYSWIIKICFQMVFSGSRYGIRFYLL